MSQRCPLRPSLTSCFPLLCHNVVPYVHLSRLPPSPSQRCPVRPSLASCSPLLCHNIGPYVNLSPRASPFSVLFTSSATTFEPRTRPLLCPIGPHSHSTCLVSRPPVKSTVTLSCCIIRCLLVSLHEVQQSATLFVFLSSCRWLLVITCNICLIMQFFTCLLY